MIDGLPKIQGTYTADKPLAPLTTVKVGGAAEIWAEFNDLNDLREFLKQKDEDLPLTILGEGSNMLIRDGGIRGVVTRLADFLHTVRLSGTEVYVEAGATCGKAARSAREVGLSGLEFYAGIPGSIGGALRMNAGCYGVETLTHLKNVDVLSDKGELKTMTPEEVGFTYRHSGLPKGWIFVAARFVLERGDKDKIRAEMQRINRERRESQPLEMPSSGSWFKNPLVNGEKKNAWKVVDEAGCRGWRQGGAQVSEKHCNFFVNTGNATARDFQILSEKVEAEALSKLNITLEREVRFMGVEE